MSCTPWIRRLDSRTRACGRGTGFVLLLLLPGLACSTTGRASAGSRLSHGTRPLAARALPVAAFAVYAGSLVAAWNLLPDSPLFYWPAEPWERSQ